MPEEVQLNIKGKNNFIDENNSDSTRPGRSIIEIANINIIPSLVNSSSNSNSNVDNLLSEEPLQEIVLKKKLQKNFKQKKIIPTKKISRASSNSTLITLHKNIDFKRPVIIQSTKQNNVKDFQDLYEFEVPLGVTNLYLDNFLNNDQAIVSYSSPQPKNISPRFHKFPKKFGTPTI